MKSITFVAIILAAVTYCDLVSGRPNVEKELKQDEKPQVNGPEKQDEIMKLVRNVNPNFTQKYDDINNVLKSILVSEKSIDEKQKEIMNIWNTLGLEELFEAWNVHLVQWYSKSTEEATEDLDSIFKPDIETAKIRRIINILAINAFEPTGQEKTFSKAFIERVAAFISKIQIVRDLLNENDPTLTEIENRILALYKENKSYRDQNKNIKAYVKSCDESKIHKLEVVTDVYYKNQNADDETLKNKVKEALKNL